MATGAGGDVDWAGAADAQERSLVNKVGDLNVRNGGGGGGGTGSNFLSSLHVLSVNQYL